MSDDKVFVFVSHNDVVACKPYAPETAEKKSSIFGDWQSKNNLIELEVVFSDDAGKYEAGSCVYIKPFIDPPLWIRETFCVDGLDVIFVPRGMIVASRTTMEYTLSSTLRTF